VSLQPALALLKFAAAANTFMPLRAGTCTGGLLLLPTVATAAAAVGSKGSDGSSSSGSNSEQGAAAAASAAEGAVDYRFGGKRSQLPLGFSYSFRLQRCTEDVPGGE
jgi:hypothetical protein